MNNTWLSKRSFHHKDFSRLDLLAEKKAARRLSVSVCLPTLNVAASMGPILNTCLELKRDYGLIDQLAIVDSKSTDETVAIALSAGADVYFDHEIMPDIVPKASGKGEALWKSLAVLTGDIIVWIDSDIVNFHPRFIYGLIGPLIDHPDIDLVKAYYQRPLISPGVGRRDNEGGRVTEICVRPFLSMFWPELAGFVQPLSGETAARRDLLRSIPFFTDYAVEVGMLVHSLRQYGLNALAQVDLDERVHTNQPLAKLGRMSFAIYQALFRLLSEEGMVFGRLPSNIREYFSYVDGEYVPVDEKITIVERQPMSGLASVKSQNAAQSHGCKADEAGSASWDAKPR